ncbi:uncharacterized protein LOC126900336 [Daktulosphaira vitifoliae]|uniref:uncharacterized protein LOC126900336 n=1 Tax=Daktulosphaira vitifoliae TaxID=58002 RepID=UPI0021AAD090|nr:uncharacterized protein LOC126900336 [Daktulosphaira vitifoliae]
MHFYIFIFMCLSSRFSNGYLFDIYPLNQSKNLTNKALLELKNIYEKNKQSDEGMNYEEFEKLAKPFVFLKSMRDCNINELFTNEVKENEYMKYDQFEKQATTFVKIIEADILNIYINSLNKSCKMTLDELRTELNIYLDLNIDNAKLNAKLNAEYEINNTQDIDFEEFRTIFVSIFKSNN